MRYSVEEDRRDGLRTIKLTDSQTGLAAEIAPDAGNNAFSLNLAGNEFLWRPDRPLDDLVQHRFLFGTPFLAPWANRLEENWYWVDGSQYHLNPGLGNLRFDHSHQPIHGLLLFERWCVERMQASDSAAEVVATLNFAEYPKLMAQFPFAHRIEMRHTLQNGRLHITTSLINTCSESFPLSLGFHPYFRLPGGNRNDWNLQMCARRHYALNDKHLPTGEASVTTPASLRVEDVELDDVYSDLALDSEGYARFCLSSDTATLHVGFGARYPVAVVFAPPTGNFVCIEPMCAITNAMNLNHRGVYECPHVPSGTAWQEEFWMEPVLNT